MKRNRSVKRKREEGSVARDDNNDDRTEGEVFRGG